MNPTPLGGTHPVSVTLEHISGQRPVRITDVEVLGPWFSVTEPPPQSVPVGERVEIPLQYAPREEGDHFAEVIVSHDGRSGAVTFYLEGRSIRPQFTVWPSVLDFGPREPGEVASESVKIQNNSRWDLEISSLSYGGLIQHVDLPLPWKAVRGEPIWFDVEAAAADLEPGREQLVIRVHDLELRRVEVRVNDCENGDPTLYDQDGDGITPCAGDCDDLDPQVYPGAAEVDDNGIDDDCDERVD